MSRSRIFRRALAAAPVVVAIATILAAQSAPASVGKAVAPVAVGYSAPADVVFASNPKTLHVSLGKSSLGGPDFRLDIPAGL